MFSVDEASPISSNISRAVILESVHLLLVAVRSHSRRSFFSADLTNVPSFYTVSSYAIEGLDNHP